jgi:hypothetical protein
MGDEEGPGGFCGFLDMLDVATCWTLLSSSEAGNGRAEISQRQWSIGRVGLRLTAEQDRGRGLSCGRNCSTRNPKSIL